MINEVLKTKPYFIRDFFSTYILYQIRTNLGSGLIRLNGN